MHGAGGAVVARHRATATDAVSATTLNCGGDGGSVTAATQHLRIMLGIILGMILGIILIWIH